MQVTWAPGCNSSFSFRRRSPVTSSYLREERWSCRYSLESYDTIDLGEAEERKKSDCIECRDEKKKEEQKI